MSHRAHDAMKFSAVLFPHTAIEESQAMRALSFFDAIILCLPWFMEPSPWFVSLKDNGLIAARRPEDAMKPEASFPRLLTEYRNWARENLDKGFASYYGAFWDPDSFLENTWKIRQDIRGGNEDGGSAEADRILRWHLTLHLAREMEHIRHETESLLTDIHDKGSPLQALFEDDSNDRDGVISFPEIALDRKVRNLNQILEAWFGLFKTCGRESPVWLTFDEEIWNSFSRGDEEITGEGKRELTFRAQWPDLSCLNTDALLSLKISLFQGGPFPELRRRVAHFGRNPSSHLDELARLMKEVKPVLPWGMSDSRINVQLRSMVIEAKSEEHKSDEVAKVDSLKTLAYITVL